MTLELLTALALFSFVSSITPGPNNLMLLASGANFGFARSLPHMFGVGIGFTVMVLLVGVGLMQLFERFPLSYDILKIGSVLYLLWLAWKIARADAPGERGGSGTPITFLQAAAFQWVNPKAWAMALTAISVYSPGREFWAILFVALIFGVINLPCISVWTLTGTEIRRFLAKPGRLRLFNATMAVLLVLSVLPVLLPLW